MKRMFFSNKRDLTLPGLGFGRHKFCASLADLINMGVRSHVLCAWAVKRLKIGQCSSQSKLYGCFANSIGEISHILDFVVCLLVVLMMGINTNIDSWPFEKSLF